MGLIKGKVMHIKAHPVTPIKLRQRKNKTPKKIPDRDFLEKYLLDVEKINEEFLNIDNFNIFKLIQKRDKIINDFLSGLILESVNDLDNYKERYLKNSSYLRIIKDLIKDSGRILNSKIYHELPMERRNFFRGYFNRIFDLQIKIKTSYQTDIFLRGILKEFLYLDKERNIQKMNNHEFKKFLESDKVKKISVLLGDIQMLSIFTTYSMKYNNHYILSNL